MFSPAQGALPSGSVRSSRRRQRPLSNDGSPPKAKRKRSALSEHTFMPLEAPEMEELKNNKIVTLPRQSSAPQKEIVVRGKKPRTGDRGSKGDGSVVLTTNDTYTVSRLPALPERLRADVTGRQHGTIYCDSGYALALTHTHAVVWPYTSNVPSPETFDFALPNPSKHTSDPLPLGSLVSPSASSSDPGLVVVVPTTGQITYWESISSASTLDLKLQRNGVELKIPGMLSGEAAVQILNAESAGFILAFSTGRTAYMSVRDGQGRPAISVQFLRGTAGGSGGGLFGSLRNALSSPAWRGDIAAVRAARPDKVGERNIVVATSKGKIQSWNIHRGGHASLQAEADGREVIVLAIKEAIPSHADLHLETFEFLDLAYTPKSFDAGGQDTAGERLLLLISLTDRGTSHYFLVEVSLNLDGLTVGNIRPIKSYTSPVSKTATSKTRLYLPNPALVAYVVFDQAVVVISMAKQPDSPDAQLRSENNLALQIFEDVVDFRQDMQVEIIGSGMEEPHGQAQGVEELKGQRFKAKHPATVLIVRGGGVVRVAATDIARLASGQIQQVTARSKLEQAVFFGTLDRNPLNFAVRPELQFSPEEVGTAALDLSLDILRSRIQHIPAVPASIDQNLRKRSKALLDLAEYIKASGVTLDRVTRWRLLWDAEKMSAAALMWKKYDATIRSKAAGRKRGLLAELVEFIHEDYKTNPVAESGELDRVRHWFINDIWNVEIAVPWAYQVIKYTYQDGHTTSSNILDILSEANDMVLSALEGAYNFRSANLELYGLEGEELEHGILISGYESLPEFWTSTIYITENLRKQTHLAALLLKEYMDKTGGEGQPTQAVVSKILREQPTLVDLEIRSNKERVRWDTAQDSSQLQIEGEQIKTLQIEAENTYLVGLAEELGLPDEAINLAEKHELFDTLASIILSEIKTSSKAEEAELSPELAQYWNTRLERLHSRVTQLFSKFGARWASAFYECQIKLGSMDEMFDQYPEQQQYLTSFLRSKPEYAQTAWLQDVIRERDFDQAAKTLLDLGLKRERDMWSKKIELSMGKLARLAGRDYSQAKGIIIPDGRKADLESTNNQLDLIKIQEHIYGFVRPAIETAVDENAELQLALEAHGNKKLNRQPRLASFLEESMERLIKQEAMDALTLIDLLTLMGDTRSEDDEFFREQQFYLALRATQKGGLSSTEQNLVQRVIWRRCMLRDDWADINNTGTKDDEQVSEQVRKTALFLTFLACQRNRLFDQGSGVKEIAPSEVLGAATDELDHRFTGLDASIRETIMKDMQVEDDTLQPYIDSSRLDEWCKTAFDLAKQDYEEEMAEKTNEGKQMSEAEERLDEIERSIGEKEKSRADNLLHSKLRFKPLSKANGNAGFKASFKQY